MKTNLKPQLPFFLVLAMFFLFAGFLFFKSTSPTHAGIFDWIATTWSNARDETVDDESVDNSNDVDTTLPEQDETHTEVLSQGGIITTKATSVNCKFKDFFSSKILNCILLIFLRIALDLLDFSLKIFSWIADADRYSIVFGKTAIYQTWGLVRDMCNMIFIMILLFSAFSTVFQYSKYNYKNILMWLVIMALLVNFSYPITRFIIDINNSLMYTILQKTFSSSHNNALSDIFYAKGSPLQSIKVFIGTDEALSGDASPLFFLLIFLFILAITILVLGLILLIRLIALVIIAILSPIGFVGIIVGKGGDWWNNLFKYAIAGPIIAFVLLLAFVLMSSLTISSSVSIAGDNNPVSNAMIAFTIPIVVLWIGIGMAVKGIDGAGTIMGKAQGFIKGAGKKLSGFNWANQQYKDYRKERDARKEEARWKAGKNIGTKFNNAQDRVAADLGSESAKKRYNKRITAKNRDDIKNKSEDAESLKNIDLHNSIENFNSATASDEDKKKVAGNFRQAFSRRDYEKTLEEEKRRADRAADAADGNTDISKRGHANHYTIHIPARASAAEIEIEKQRVAKNIAAREERIRNAKAAHMQKGREAIKAAEEIGKI